MFASEVKTPVTLKNGFKVVVRKLSGRSLEKASEARQIAVADSMKRMGGDVLRSLREMQSPAAPTPGAKPDYVAATKARFALYDRQTVLVAGLVEWEHARKLEPSAIEDLDEDSAQECHEAILNLSLSPLDPAEFEAAQGKGSGLSTSS